MSDNMGFKTSPTMAVGVGIILLYDSRNNFAIWSPYLCRFMTKPNQRLGIGLFGAMLLTGINQTHVKVFIFGNFIFGLLSTVSLIKPND